MINIPLLNLLIGIIIAVLIILAVYGLARWSYNRTLIFIYKRKYLENDKKIYALNEQVKKLGKELFK
ncbi:MAG: hypothetical protein NT099_06020 [Candidatus Saganbacteria bacterium]|nr:hypothetical protein [Candidatus Saganbacteria bacterium]